MTMRLMLLTLLIAVASPPLFASANEDEETKLLLAELHVGAEWAMSIVRQRTPRPDIVGILKRRARIGPYGETYMEASGPRRVESQIFRISKSRDRLIVLNPLPGKLKLIVGAPVSAEVRELTGRNSIYLLDGRPGTEKFLAVLKLITDADQELKKEYKISALADPRTQDPFNREVKLIGEITAIDLPLNPKLSAEHLLSFMYLLSMAECESLLSSIGTEPKN